MPDNPIRVTKKVSDLAAEARGLFDKILALEKNHPKLPEYQQQLADWWGQVVSTWILDQRDLQKFTKAIRVIIDSLAPMLVIDVEDDEARPAAEEAGDPGNGDAGPGTDSPGAGQDADPPGIQ